MKYSTQKSCCISFYCHKVLKCFTVITGIQLPVITVKCPSTILQCTAISISAYYPQCMRAWLSVLLCLVICFVTILLLPFCSQICHVFLNSTFKFLPQAWSPAFCSFHHEFQIKRKKNGCKKLTVLHAEDNMMQIRRDFVV